MSSTFRPLDAGMGEAIFARTYQRGPNRGADVLENWGDTSDRVAFGNVSLLHSREHNLDDIVLHDLEYHAMRAAMRKGVLPMSGRHLQQGDAQQATRPMEVFTNCSTGALSSLKFYLMLNGSGVGRNYADALMLVDWSKAPMVLPVLGVVPEAGELHTGKYLTPGTMHPDAAKGAFSTLEQAMSFYDDNDILTFRVPDTREGWAQAVEYVEALAFEGTHANKVLLVDWSAVRPEGSPIGGMQDRPASGPIAPMSSMQDAASIKYRGFKPWKQAMYADHYYAKSVQVGGARRAARIAVKPWTDEDILEFINIKNDDLAAGGDGLWSSNNSVGVDAEFWRLVQETEDAFTHDDHAALTVEGVRAWAIFHAMVKAQYEHGTGEPGFLNLDKLPQNDEGLDIYDDGVFAQSDRYALMPQSRALSKALVAALKTLPYKNIVNPCGEISLLSLGGFCVIADVVPFHADSLDEARNTFRLAARALMRVNTMHSLYEKEVIRTNRIGVGFTGLFEFAWKFFGYTFLDLIDLDISQDFWTWMAETRDAVIAETESYAKVLGVTVPHTALTVKPSGTISKLWGLTEGAHPPASAEYIRWVQFDQNSAADTIMEYEFKGYPVQHEVKNADGVVTYPNVSLVGFPTKPFIRTLGIPDEKFIAAPDVAFEDHFKWVSLVERFWLGEERGNQVSYTAKFDQAATSLEDYTTVMLKWMPQVRAISVMPSSDYATTVAKYGYSPEQPITSFEYQRLTKDIAAIAEVITDDDLRCLGGACPII